MIVRWPPSFPARTQPSAGRLGHRTGDPQLVRSRVRVAAPDTFQRPATMARLRLALEGVREDLGPEALEDEVRLVGVQSATTGERGELREERPPLGVIEVHADV